MRVVDIAAAGEAGQHPGEALPRLCCGELFVLWGKAGKCVGRWATPIQGTDLGQVQFTCGGCDQTLPTTPVSVERCRERYVARKVAGVDADDGGPVTALQLHYDQICCWVIKLGNHHNDWLFA